MACPFDGDSSVSRNSETNSKTKTKACPFCRRLFLTECTLFEHLTCGCMAEPKRRSQVAAGNYCTATNRLRCHLCEEMFRSVWFLTRHLLWIHRDLSEGLLDRVLRLGEIDSTPDYSQLSSIRERWRNFILTPPPDYIPSDED